MTEEQIEREQVEQVFGLTGGELEREPWLHVWCSRLSDGSLFMPEDPNSWYVSKHCYWYEGVPDYVERELNQGDEFWKQKLTLVVFGGGYLSAPDTELYDGQGIWKLVATYNNSGECECPLRDWNHDTREDERNRKVTSADAAIGSGESGECPYCEERIGEEHGYISIGEGYEAVYVLDPQPPEPVEADRYCKDCSAPLICDRGAWVDETDGDCCPVTNELHIPKPEANDTCPDCNGHVSNCYCGGESDDGTTQ